MSLTILNAATTFKQLITAPKTDFSELIKEAKQQKIDVIIVLDDDPTGTQTIYDIPVLTTWSVEDIEQELQADTPLFYILTNSRSLPEKAAEELASTIGKNIRAANKKLKKRYLIISRSDSTLRGHYPVEVDALAQGLERQFVHIIIPAFFEGGRYTLQDIHYVQQNDQLIPAAQTPYAQDRSFGYQHSDLKKWVEEKTNQSIRAADVISFGIEELRTQNIETLTAKLNKCQPNSVCIVNAASYYDLQVFAMALLHANISAICRTAASFVAALAALPKKELLTSKDLSGNTAAGGLIVVGSYVPQTTKQLQHLQQHHQPLVSIELDINTLLSAGENTSFLLQQYSIKINEALQNRENVVLYTSRALVVADDMEGNLSIGTKISGYLTTIVSNLKIRPNYLIAKGGITSSDIATKSLQVKRAIVKGQILPGVPVWTLGSESKFEGLSYIIFPGNVGGDDAITKAVKNL